MTLNNFIFWWAKHENSYLKWCTYEVIESPFTTHLIASIVNLGPYAFSYSNPPAVAVFVCTVDRTFCSVDVNERGIERQPSTYLWHKRYAAWNAWNINSHYYVWIKWLRRRRAYEVELKKVLCWWENTLHFIVMLTQIIMKYV